MKKFKKAFSVALSTLFILGAVQQQSSVDVKAFYDPDVIHKVNGVDGMNGEDKGFTKPEASQIQWQQGIRIKLRAIHNFFYKDWWEIKLVSRNGVLQLEGPTDIPGNLTFDDVYIIGFNDSTHSGRTRHIFRTDLSQGSASHVLKEQMKRFNDAQIRLGEPIFIQGLNWDDTLKFSSSTNAIYGVPHSYFGNYNDYSQGYKNRNRWDVGFIATRQGLKEAVFFHTIYPWDNYL